MKQIVFFIFSLLSVQIFAQGTWIQKSDFPGGSRMRGSTFVINGTGYMLLGANRFDTIGDGYAKELWAYEHTTDTWMRKADFPGSGRQGAVAFAIGNKGYAGTGTTVDSFYRDFWEYDPVLDAWTQKASFGGNNRQGAAGFSVNGKGYITTGNRANPVTYYNDLWEYSPATDQWTQKASLPAQLRKSAAVFVIGNKAYLGGGDYTTVFGDFWEYEPAIDTWTRLANFGGGNMYYSIGFSIGDNGYMGIGSVNGAAKSDTFFMYNPVSNTWLRQANYGGGPRTIAAGFAVGGKIYIGTGYAPNDIWKQDWWEFTPDDYTAIGLADNTSGTVLVYPNPTTSDVMLKLPDSDMPFDVCIFNSTGAVVKRMQVSPTSLATISKQGLMPGVYFIQVTNKGHLIETCTLVVSG